MLIRHPSIHLLPLGLLIIGICHGELQAQGLAARPKPLAYLAAGGNAGGGNLGVGDLGDGVVSIANLEDQTGRRLEPPAAVIPAQRKPFEQMTAAEKIVFEAERRFQSGKFFLQEGKPAEARREFDQAIDVLLAAPDELEERELVERKFEELSRQIHRYDLEALGAGVPQDSPVYIQSPLPEILEMTFPVDPRLKDKAMAAIQAGSSQLPLTVNDAVASYINYFTSERGRRTLLGGLRRAGRYRNMISRVLAEEGVPQELIHLSQAESGFAPQAISRKSCVGLWQFKQSTGVLYGLAVTAAMDDRMDPERATRAAARHLRDLYNQTGDWYLAMAAYNCGAGCVERAVQRTGYADFWELHRRNALPKETRNYVPAILAMVIVSKNLAAYGIPPVQPEPPLEYDVVELTAPANLGLIADAADVPVAGIRELNPQLLKQVAPAGASIRVPRNRSSIVLAGLASVPAEKRASWRLHRIGAGDTLASISKRYATTAGLILAANARLDEGFFESPEEGGTLIIPAAAAKERIAPRTRRTRTASAASRSRSYSASSRARAKARVAAVSRQAPAGKTAKRPAARR